MCFFTDGPKMFQFVTFTGVSNLVHIMRSKLSLSLMICNNQSPMRVFEHVIFFCARLLKEWVIFSKHEKNARLINYFAVYTKTVR